jgi:phosphatidylglycerophosphatase A
LRRLISTFFYSGYFPICPGTASSALAAAAALGLYHLGMPWWGMAALAAATLFVGVALANWAIVQFRSDDPKQFVFDEAMGMWVSALVLYLVSGLPSWVVLVIAFFWFRLFDIVKPPPARQAERIGHGSGAGGWGVCMDDLFAGVYALAASWLTIFLWQRLAA